MLPILLFAALCLCSDFYVYHDELMNATFDDPKTLPHNLYYKDNDSVVPQHVADAMWTEPREIGNITLNSSIEFEIRYKPTEGSTSLTKSILRFIDECKGLAILHPWGRFLVYYEFLKYNVIWAKQLALEIWEPSRKFCGLAIFVETAQDGTEWTRTVEVWTFNGKCDQDEVWKLMEGGRLPRDLNPEVVKFNGTENHGVYQVELRFKKRVSQ